MGLCIYASVQDAQYDNNNNNVTEIIIIVITVKTLTAEYFLFCFLLVFFVLYSL